MSDTPTGPLPPSLPGEPTATTLLLDTLLDIARSLIVVMNRDGRILRFSHSCEQLTGYHANEVIGHYAWEFLLPPGAVEPAKAFFEALDDMQFPHESELPVVTRDGTKRFISWTSKKITDPHAGTELILATGVDVTRQTRLAEDLKAVTTSEEQLREYFDLLELAQDSIILRTPEGVIRYWNAAAERLYGWNRTEVQEQTVQDLLRTQYPVAGKAVAEALLRDGRWEGELRQTTRDGREVIVRSKQTLRRDAAGQPLSVLEVNVDITAFKRMGAEREQLLEELAAQRARFESILQQLPIGVVVADMQSRCVTFVNSRAEQVLGMEVLPGTPSAVIRKALRFADGQSMDLDAPFIQTLNEGHTVTDYDLHVERPDGQRVRVWANASPVRNRIGETVAMVLTLEHSEDRWQRALSASIPLDDTRVTPETFVRRFGRKHAALGRPPLEGRLLALLLLNPEPVSLSEAARQLQATKGGLSKVVSEMHERGDLEITRDPSSREHHLALTNSVYLRDLMNKRDLSASIAALGYAFLRDNPDVDPAVRQRVQDLADIRAQHTLNISRLLEVRLQAQERARQSHLQDNWDAVPPRTER